MSIEKKKNKKRKTTKMSFFVGQPIKRHASGIRCRPTVVFRSEKKKTFAKNANFWPLRPPGKSRLFIYLPLFAGATIDSGALLTGFW